MLLIKCRRLKRGYLSMKDNGTFGWLSTSHRKKLVLMIAAILMVCILECVRLGVIMTIFLTAWGDEKSEIMQKVIEGNIRGRGELRQREEGFLTEMAKYLQLMKWYVQFL